MTTFDEFLHERMQNEEFRAEYEALEPEFAIIQALINARENAGLSRKQLSELSGISLNEISMLESGIADPSIRTLQKLANGLGKKVRIAFF